MALVQVDTPQFQIPQGGDFYIRVRRKERGGQIALDAPPGTTGTLWLTFNNRETVAISVAAGSDTVLQALQALSTIGSGLITVTGPAGGPWVYRWAGRLSRTRQPLLTARWSLSNPVGSIAITELPRDVSGWTGTCEIRDKPAGGSPDATITEVVGSAGQIDMSGAAQGEVVLWFKAETTAGFVWAGTHQIDLLMVDTTVTPHRSELWFAGRASVQRSVIPT